MPEERAPVILFALLNTPATVFFTKLLAPSNIPKLPSKGPWINPYFGLSNKSKTPEDMLPNKPTGFPIIFKLPNNFKT